MGRKGIIPFALLACLSYSCAKIGSISGGEKDTIPPKLLKSVPPNYATHFSGKKVVVSFNEFIDLKDIQKDFLVSPPLKKNPEVKAINKDLVVEPLEDILPNTTYTLSFGNSVVDYTAGNPVYNFEFVFSSGSSVDSLSIQGRLVNAFDLTPSKDPILVMLYTNMNDSAPYLELPAYIGRTDNEGRFSLNNLKEDQYRLFALKDANSNLKFDILSESIAFLDSSFHLFPNPIKDYMQKTDTIHKSKSQKKVKPSKTRVISPSDSIASDSSKMIKRKKYGVFHDLFLFTEENAKQYLKEYKRVSSELIRFVMNQPLGKNDTFVMNPVNFSPSKSWFLHENHLIGDTLDYWITDTAFLKQESMRITLLFPMTDSTGKISSRIDTIDLRISKKETGKKKKQVKLIEPKLHLKFNIVPGTPFDLNNLIIIEGDKPVKSVDPTSIEFYRMEDTIPKAVKFRLIRDSLNMRKFYIPVKWEENTDYRFKIYPHAFTDIYDHPVDTMIIKFRTQKSDYYGRLIVTLDSVKMNMIIQLLQKDAIIHQQMISKYGKLLFDYLYPGKYKVKMIFDRNHNGKWDTGKYLRKIQPEKVFFYPEDIEIRSNWDMEIRLSGKE